MGDMVESKSTHIIATRVSKKPWLFQNRAFAREMFPASTDVTQKFCDAFQLAMTWLVTKKTEGFFLLTGAIFIHLSFPRFLRFKDPWYMWCFKLSRTPLGLV
jgi:hypothetical protein